MLDAIRGEKCVALGRCSANVARGVVANLRQDSSVGTIAVVVSIVIIILTLVSYALSHRSRPSSTAGESNPGASPTSASRPIPRPRRDPTPGRIYKARIAGGSSPIIFRPLGTGAATASPDPVVKGLSGLRDAVTGTWLDPSRTLYRCGRCEVFYHRESLELVRVENAGCCVACGAASIVLISATRASQESGRNYEAGVTTLADYRSKVGQVVIFEGRCVSVLPSRRGSDFAVMFEDKSWTRGFKMVVLKKATATVGSPSFFFSLMGKRLRVRGLIVNHPRFGYEIIVNDRAMILEVK